MGVPPNGGGVIEQRVHMHHPPEEVRDEAAADGGAG
jgi:hypothetical protein